MSKIPFVGLSFLKTMLDKVKSATKLKEIKRVKVDGENITPTKADVDILGPDLNNKTGRVKLEVAFQAPDTDLTINVEAIRNLALEPENVLLNINGEDIKGADIDIRPNIDFGWMAVKAGLVFIIEIPGDIAEIILVTKQIEVGLLDVL